MLEVKKADGRGLGLFATENIKAGAVVIRFEGEVIPYSQCPAKEKEYILLIGGGYGIIPRNEARFANHSCDPNCEVFGEHLIAIKNVPKGNELTFDYCLLDGDEKYKWDDAWTFECKCGSPKCRKALDKFVYKKSEAIKSQR